ncbi:MAG: YgjV family protein [Candidatus Woesearchaeota archaeon]
MLTAFLLSQIFGGIAFIFDFASFQFKKREHILVTLMISSLLISIQSLGYPFNS